MAKGTDIDVEHLPAELSRLSSTALREPGHQDINGNMPPLANARKAFENEYPARALRATRGKRQLAADLLGISRKNLWEKQRANPIADTEAWSEADE